MTISEIILFVLFVVVIISYFVSNYKGNKFLKEERDKEIEFRAAILNRMNRIGYYLVVVYWYDSKDYTSIYTWAKDGGEAFLRAKSETTSTIKGMTSGFQLNRKFAIVSVQFLGGE